MLKQKEDICNYSGTIVFMVLFFLFVSSFSDKSSNQTFDSVQYKFKSELCLSQVKAVIVDAIPLASFQKSCLSILDNFNFNLFKATHKILADNHKIYQCFHLLQRTQFLIKPILLNRIYYHFIPDHKDDLPVLS